MNDSVRTWVEVSKSALVHNARELKRCLSPGAGFMAVVKSNAYGHGIEQVAKALRSEADWFGVDSLPEAERIRDAGVGRPTLVMGYTRPAALGRLVRAGFSQVVYSKDTVDELSRLAGPRRKAKVHVKIETGTSRQGVPLGELRSFLKHVAGLPNVRVEGMSTHFANIEDTNDSSYAMRQLKAYRQALDIAGSVGVRPELRHTACSAAILAYPETHFDLVRAGISLYGLWSSPVTRRVAEGSNLKIELRPAMTWKTVVAQVKRLPKGSHVSYGLTERLTRESRVAVVPVGYWDGYDRKLSSVGNVIVRGRRAKVLGRICMNMCVVDVTDIRGVRPDDEVVLLGEQGKERITADELADRIGTINYEVVTRVNPILPRVLL